MELAELEKKSRNAKLQREQEFKEMFNQLSESLTKSFDTRLKQIERDIAKIKLHIEAIEEEIEIEVKILRHRQTKKLFYEVYDLKETILDKIKIWGK